MSTDEIARAEQSHLDVAPPSFSIVTPAKAGVQGKRRDLAALDARFRGHDNKKMAFEVPHAIAAALARQNYTSVFVCVPLFLVVSCLAAGW
jgi:hypothetical protein